MLWYIDDDGSGHISDFVRIRGIAFHAAACL